MILLLLHVPATFVATHELPWKIRCALHPRADGELYAHYGGLEVNNSGRKGPSRQPMRAVQNGRVSAEHFLDYGACFLRRFISGRATDCRQIFTSRVPRPPAPPLRHALLPVSSRLRTSAQSVFMGAVASPGLSDGGLSRHRARDPNPSTLSM
jgi:hypothetical protein